MLKFIGKQYSGFDPVTNMTIRVVGGQQISVSETKENQLLKDYPKEWVRVGKSETPVVEESTPEVEEIEEVDDPVEKAKPKKKVKLKRKK